MQQLCCKGAQRWELTEAPSTTDEWPWQQESRAGSVQTQGPNEQQTKEASMLAGHIVVRHHHVDQRPCGGQLSIADRQGDAQGLGARESQGGLVDLQGMAQVKQDGTNSRGCGGLGRSITASCVHGSAVNVAGRATRQRDQWGVG